jgi:SRSO17 transposase
MKTQRNFTNIASEQEISSQNLQHFMSESPWSAQRVIDQIQQEVANRTDFVANGMLLLDESADEVSGEGKAASGRQWNGRLGKVETSQVAVLLAYANDDTWCWVDGDLYLQEHWFSPEMAERREKVGIPEECSFQTKIEQGIEMIQRAAANGLPFTAVGCDELYGRSHWFRATLDADDIIYMAEVPHTMKVYLEQPEIGVPEVGPDHQGRKPTQPRVLNAPESLTVRQVARLPETTFRSIRVRSTERGELVAEFAVRAVWTNRDGLPTARELLVIRRNPDGEESYAFSNAPVDTPLAELARMMCQRHFVERSIQDAKTELGWDELEAQKYRAWEHHLALTILASWFIAETKLEWQRKYERDPALARQLEVEVLPRLSTANVRALLRAVMPLRQFSQEEAIQHVVKHLVNRTRSRRSRMKKGKHRIRPSPQK